MLLLSNIDQSAVIRLLARFGVELRVVPAGECIPGSYWGESEAGLRGNALCARLDTPVHSILHELAHYICMTAHRRAGLDRDAGGDDAEESAVCYLQILLAGQLTRVGRERLWADMDAWGYSFRLGNTRSWFEQDAQDCSAWLRLHGIIDAVADLTGTLRERQ